MCVREEKRKQFERKQVEREREREERRLEGMPDRALENFWRWPHLCCATTSFAAESCLLFSIRGDIYQIRNCSPGQVQR